MQIAADHGQRFIANFAQLATGSLIGHRANLLRHRVRNPIQSGLLIGRNADVVLEPPVPAGERYGQEQPGYHRVPAMGHYDNRPYPALLPSGYRVQVAEQNVAADQELYSGYSSAALAASPLGSAEVHSAASA
jgi:hypothetical protein